MELRPEQIAALDYARRRGTEAPGESIRLRAARAFDELEVLVESLPEDLARRRPAPDGWSVQEVVDHLVASHRTAADQLAELLAGRSPEHPIPAGLQSESPLAASWPALRRELHWVHKTLLAALERASDDAPMEARAPVEMVIKCAAPDGALEPVHWVESFDWKAYSILLTGHTRQHVAQIERVLRAVRESAE